MYTCIIYIFIIVFSPYQYISIIIICHDNDGKTSFQTYISLTLSLF